MKKIAVVISVFICIMLCSCATLVRVNTMVPAEVNLSGYNRVAVSSVENVNKITYRYYFKTPLTNEEKTFLPEPLDRFTLYFTDPSSDAFSMIEVAVGNSTEDYISGYSVDKMISSGKRAGNSVRAVLTDKGIDALVTSRINYCTLEHCIEAIPFTETSEDGKEICGTRYYLIQEASVNLTVEVTDVVKNSKVFSKTFSNEKEDSIYLGKRITGEQFQKERYYLSSPDVIFENLIHGLRYEVQKCFTRTMETNSFFLKKSKSEIIKNGIKLSDGGFYDQALELFLEGWNRNHDFVSGYNASIMYFALGEFDSAASLANEVFRYTGDPDALKLAREFSSLIKADEKAKKQMQGIEIPESERELVGF